MCSSLSSCVNPQRIAVLELFHAITNLTNVEGVSDTQVSVLSSCFLRFFAALVHIICIDGVLLGTETCVSLTPLTLVIFVMLQEYCNTLANVSRI